MTGLPVLWLCGPPGVGKSTAAWALFSRYACRGVIAGHVDVDQLGIRYPAPAEDPANTLVKAANLADVLRNYQAAGATRMVVSGVALPEEVPAFEAEVRPAMITWVRLHADAEDLHHRFLHRNGAAHLLPEVDRHAGVLARSRFATTWIDTTDLDVTTVVEAITRAVPGWPDLPVRASGTAVTDHRRGTRPAAGRQEAGRLVLLCGPRAVGTSTVGWEVFQRLQQHGTAAIIDLAQVGFVGPAAALPLGRHGVRARNLAAMVRNCYRGGAAVVVAVGSVHTIEVSEEYAGALAPDSLTVCRLQAAPWELVRRIRARAAAAGGPYLAGDDLRGRPPEDLQAVILQAMAEAVLLESSGVGDVVLDTTARSAADCAAWIVRRAAFA